MSESKLDKDIASPELPNRFSMRPGAVSDEYQSWPRMSDLQIGELYQGLDEDRAFDLIDIDQNKLIKRLKAFFNPDTSEDELKEICPGLTRNSAGYEPKKAREKLLKAESFNINRVVRYHLRPLDVRWCYFTPVSPIWKRSRPKLFPQISAVNAFVISRPAGVASVEGSPFLFVRNLIARDAMRGHAVAFPINIAETDRRDEQQNDLFPSTDAAKYSPNLSGAARSYLEFLNFSNIDEDND